MSEFSPPLKMRITLDTNVLGPVAVPGLYPDAPQRASLLRIRDLIELGQVRPFVSEASMALEALSHADRLDVFIRDWASRKAKKLVPTIPAQRQQVFSAALKLGTKILRVPRVAIGSFFELKAENWATEEVYDFSTRSDRQSKFVRTFPQLGTAPLKALGSQLANAHGLDTKPHEYFAQLSGTTAAEHMWMQGLIAEFDNPKQFASQKKYVARVRDLIAEWCDLDILSSHHAYGNDFFCTLDDGKSSGSGALLHAENRSRLLAQFPMMIMSPDELVGHLRDLQV